MNKIKVFNKWSSLFLLSCLYSSGPVFAADFCFLRAENLYEQVYCELKARGMGKNLPAYFEFQRNPPNTQYLLVMRPAKQIGVILKPPRSHKAVFQSSPKKESIKTESMDSSIPINSEVVALPTNNLDKSCTVEKSRLLCPRGTLRLVTNRHNKHLAPRALSPENIMAMPRYRGKSGDGIALGDYLLEGYQRYLTKMVDIGLGGSTMSLAKFEQLYFSMADMDIDFSERMEVLYNYLKKDKASLGVSESLTLPTLSLQDCQSVGQRFVSCPHNLKNYLFEWGEG